MKVDSPQYLEHSVFANFAMYAKFYRTWAQHIFLWPTQGTQAIANIDSYSFSSLAGTFESIHDVLQNGKINDAWTLLRKYNDAIIINLYSITYLQNHFNIDNFVVTKINDWISGKQKLPSIKTMSDYILGCSNLHDANKVILGDTKKYHRTRRRCNEHTHYKFFQHVMLNDSDVYIKNRTQLLDTILEDARYLFFLHFSYVIFMNQHYAASSDYIDHMECGLSPPFNSQYWVAPFVQDVFDELKEYRPEVVLFLQKHTAMDFQ